MKKKILVVIFAATAVIGGFSAQGAAAASTNTASTVRSSSVDNPFSLESTKTKEAEVEETLSTGVAEPVEGGDWWSVFSKYYILNGNFDVTFNITLDDIKLEKAENSPALVLCSDANRGRSGYKEYFTLHSYFPENDFMTYDGNEISYVQDWNDWRIWKNAMAGAVMDVNVKREGNGFTVTYTVFGSDGDVYKSTVSFITNADETMRLFWAGDITGFTINRYTRDKDYVQAELPKGVSLKKGVFEIFPDAACVSGGGTSVDVDLTKIFTSPDEESVTVDFAKVETVTVTVDGNQQMYKIKVLNENPCKSCKVVTGSGVQAVVGEVFHFKVAVAGADMESPVTEELVWGNTSDYELSCKEEEDGVYLFNAVPLTAIEDGAVEVSCGSRTAYCVYAAKRAVTTPPSIEISTGSGIGTEVPKNPDTPVSTGSSIVTPTRNKCVSLKSSQGNIIYANDATVQMITVYATSEHTEETLTDEIKLVSGTAIETWKPIQQKDGSTSQSFAVLAKKEDPYVKFVCGDEELLINFHIRSTTSTTTASTAPTTTTQTTTTPTTQEQSTEPTTTTPTTTTTPEPTTPEPTNPVPVTPEPATPDTSTTSTTKKKKTMSLKSMQAKRKSGVVIVSGKVVKKAKVKVTIKSTTKTVTANKNGKFTVKFSKKISKKIKSGTKIKVVATKTGYKKVSASFKIK